MEPSVLYRKWGLDFTLLKGFQLRPLKFTDIVNPFVRLSGPAAALPLY